MNIVRGISVLIVLSALFLGACSNETATLPEATAPQDQEAENMAQTGPNTLPGQQAKSIIGTVLQTDKGLTIFADTGNYLVAGQDLSDVVGKYVKATGTVKEAAGVQIIEVSAISVIQE